MFAANFSAKCVRINASPQPESEIAIEVCPSCSAQIAEPKAVECPMRPGHFNNMPPLETPASLWSLLN
jgi:hypothetical protein